MGSSPHTRGALGEIDVQRLLRAIIPAYAGSTHLSIPRRALMTDHPRIRGEHLMKYGLVIEAAGSSPHTRGAPPRRLDMHVCQRIIPAYAGSTPVRSSAHTPPSDHPRIRGEHVVVVESDGRGQGSSPHTRGARRRRSTPQSQTRIIPAYAGSTYPGSRPCGRRPDHPRIRGEHICSKSEG